MKYHAVITSHLIGPTPASSNLLSRLMTGLNARVTGHDVDFATHAPQKPRLYPLSLVALPGHENRMEKFAQSIPHQPTLDLMRNKVGDVVGSDSEARVIMVAYGLSIHPTIEVAREFGPEKVMAIVGISPILQPPVKTNFPIQTLEGVTVPVFLVGSAMDTKFNMAMALALWRSDTCTTCALKDGHHSFDIPSIIMGGKPKKNPHYKEGQANEAYTKLVDWTKDKLRQK